VGIRSGCKSGYRIVGLFLYPISYIPKDSILFLYKKLTVRIEYEEGKYESQYLTTSQKELFSKDVEKLVINPEDINQYSPPPHQVGYPEIDYVIITSSELTEHFEPLVNWLRKTGIWAETISTTSINNMGYGGRDLQENIRKFNIDYFDNHGLKYVLLAGDVSIIPARLARAYCGGDTGDISCDLYYADLQGTWDDNNDNIFGEPEVDSVDLYYDLYLGRVSVEDNDEVSRYINKLFTYEKTPDTLYQKRLLLPAAYLWPDYNHMLSQYSIADLSPTGWTDDTIDQDSDERLISQVRDSIGTDSYPTDGFAFCHLVAHGTWDYTCLGHYWQYHRSDPPDQNNYNKLTIFNSIACNVGCFDLSDHDCLAEEMMKAEGCAIAVIMNSREGRGCPPGMGPSEIFDVNFYDVLFEDIVDIRRIAANHQQSKEICQSRAQDESHYRWCYYSLNLLGEPSMPLRNDTTRTMRADFPHFIYTEPQACTVRVRVVTVADSHWVYNAQVCLWKGNEIYETKSTNALGRAVFFINPLTTGSMYVTVTAKNKLPIEDSCLVSPLQTDRRLSVEVRNFQNGGVTINRVTTVTEPYVCAWAVGDSGQVFKLSQSGCILPNYPVTLNAEYNLTGVSFANSQIGYIVGYKRDGSDKWKGAIWKTENGGENWSVQYPVVVEGLTVPFLDVHAVDERHAWISCGHGEVLRTTDGGNNWVRKTKPGGDSHFGWLWGIDAPDANTAWVCSDQSGLIAMTTNGGEK
jgi:hypothetical protein